ncbi:MAG: hypothetical protein ACRD2H_13470 [Terriglobales bacterium]
MAVEHGWIEPRITPPLSVAGRCVVARWRAASGSGEELFGFWQRDTHGNSRVDYGDPPQISRIWLADRLIMAWLSHEERTARVNMGVPIYPRLHEWVPAEPCDFEFTDERRAIHGLDCARVALHPLEPPMAALRDELWAAPEWGLVLLDDREASEASRSWEIIDLQRREPDARIFEFQAEYRRLE